MPEAVDECPALPFASISNHSLQELNWAVSGKSRCILYTFWYVLFTLMLQKCFKYIYLYTSVVFYSALSPYSTHCVHGFFFGFGDLHIRLGRLK